MTIVQATVQRFLDKHQCQTEVDAIMKQIRRGAPHAQFESPVGTVHLIQLYHPVTMRQESFIGNVLFNTYLGLKMQHALESFADADSIPLIQDLQSYYFLLCTNVPLQELNQKIRRAWIEGLEELYFSEPLEEERIDFATRGYVGQFSKMLQNYFKSNIQPFPLLIVPRVYAERLERQIRAHLLQQLDTGEWRRGVANFTANFSYFYGQTSGGSGDVQSCPNFLRRLVSVYQVIRPEDMEAAFQLPAGTNFEDSATKTLIQEKLFAKGNKPSFYAPKLEEVFRTALAHFGNSIEQQGSSEETSEWLFRYHREKGVFLDVTPEELVDQLTVGTTIGGRSVSPAKHEHAEERCLVCGFHAAQLSGATIVASDSFSKFHNHTVNRGSSEKRICYNCALYAYLNIKLTGSKSGGMGQIPANGNLVFHSGSYTEDEIYEFKDDFEYAIKQARGTGHDEDDFPDLQSDLVLDGEEELELERSGSIRGMLVRSEHFDAYCLPIQFGLKQIILFFLPGLQDEIQKKLNKNWYANLLLLSWLYQLGKEKGSYYYLSLPAVNNLLEDRSVLVVRDKVLDAAKQIQLHEHYQKVVPELSKSRARDGFKHEMMVAERVQRDPFGVMSQVLREWMTSKKWGAKRQRKIYRLLSAIYKIDREGIALEASGNTKLKEELDQFTNRLFHTLDVLDLLPKSMKERPHKFEKWARELLAPLKRRDVDFGQELERWQSRLYRQKSFYPLKHTISDEVRAKRLDALQEFKTYCMTNQTLLVKHTHDLLTSLLARAIAYLYPVIELARYYTRLYIGRTEMFEEDVIRSKFEDDVKVRFENLKSKGYVGPQHLEWAKEHLLMHARYYSNFKNTDDMNENGGEEE